MNNSDKICVECFYYLRKDADQSHSWCWRFDIETTPVAYCNDEYFIDQEKGIEEFKLSPQIIGYFKRKKDFDKNEKLKLLISGGCGILGTLIGVLLGSKLN